MNAPMKPAQRNGFVAWLIDTYLLVFVLSIVFILIIHFIKIDLREWLKTAIATLFSLVIIAYHWSLYKSFDFISPGEHVTGTFLVNGEKVYKNPFGINRAVLWIMTILKFLGIILTNLDLNSLDSKSIIILLEGFLTFLSLVLINKGYWTGLILFIPVALFKLYVLFMKPPYFYYPTHMPLDDLIGSLFAFAFLLIPIFYFVMMYSIKKMKWKS
jgi:hypothetical protein